MAKTNLTEAQHGPKAARILIAQLLKTAKLHAEWVEEARNGTEESNNWDAGENWIDYTMMMLRRDLEALSREEDPAPEDVICRLGEYSDILDNACDGYNNGTATIYGRHLWGLARIMSPFAALLETVARPDSIEGAHHG